jgi:hypothetical protein
MRISCIIHRIAGLVLIIVITRGSRVARNHPNANLTSYMYGAKTSTGVIREHLIRHQESHESWCIKHHQPNKMKYGKEETKAREEASSKAILPSLVKLQFTEENFKQALVTFIVEDDQVSRC